MMWLDGSFSGELVDFLTSLAPFAAGGFLAGCAAWIVSYVVWSVFRIIRGH